jgi:hypothetical protein
VNSNIQKIIDAAPKGVGDKWISILQAEALVISAVRVAASIARNETLTRSGLTDDFSGTVDVETRILDHFGI